MIGRLKSTRISSPPTTNSNTGCDVSPMAREGFDSLTEVSQLTGYTVRAPPIRGGGGGSDIPPSGFAIGLTQKSDGGDRGGGSYCSAASRDGAVRTGVSSPCRRAYARVLLPEKIGTGILNQRCVNTWF